MAIDSGRVRIQIQSCNPFYSCFSNLFQLQIPFTQTLPRCLINKIDKPSWCDLTGVWMLRDPHGALGSGDIVKTIHSRRDPHMEKSFVESSAASRATEFLGKV